MQAQPPGTTVVNNGEVLSFKLGNEEYGVDILQVREIRRIDAITSIAHAPAFIKGVIELRGVIVPILDLRIKFAVGDGNTDAFTVVIILNVSDRLIGAVVDSVSDVITLPQDCIRPAPRLGKAVDTAYIRGLGSLDERMIILVDMEKLLTSDELGLIEQTLH